jgi:hypothetical protein
MISPLPTDLDPVDMTALYARYPALERVETNVDHRLPGRAALVGMLPKGAVGAEIGVYTGVFSEMLIAKARPRRMFLVDPWEKLHGTHFPKGPYFGDGALPTAAGREAATLRAQRCADAHVVEAFSLPWIAELPDGVLDWVYLDTSHRYADTLAELQALAPKLTARGILTGDDAWTRRDGPHIGVFHAIRDFCQAAPFELYRLDHNGQWAIRRRIARAA